jgi:hypothetical protein
VGISAGSVVRWRLNQAADVAREQLDPRAQAIRDLGRHVDAGLEQLEAGARRRSEIVVRGRRECALADKAVDLDPRRPRRRGGLGRGGLR